MKKKITLGDSAVSVYRSLYESDNIYVVFENKSSYGKPTKDWYKVTDSEYEQLAKFMMRRMLDFRNEKAGRPNTKDGVEKAK